MGVAIGATVAPVAFAQEANRTLDEITVTAQRREQSVQDVPISITAFSGDQLRDLGVRSTIDLALVTPGLTIGQNSGDGDFPFISLRGVTLRDFADTNESPSAVYVNEFYKANLVGLDGQIFDMKRVEVLRGPQGTLYGRNATGGLIHYITNAPTKEVDGYLELTAGDFGTIRAEGALSGPLSETLSARLSVLHSENDGWLENAFANNSDGNGLDATSVRLQLLFEPNGSLEVFVDAPAQHEQQRQWQHVHALLGAARCGYRPRGRDAIAAWFQWLSGPDGVRSARYELRPGHLFQDGTVDGCIAGRMAVLGLRARVNLRLRAVAEGRDVRQ